MKQVYQIWCAQYVKLSKPIRYTIGSKVHEQFLRTIDLLVRAQYKHVNKKQELLNQASEEFDILKYFITMLWEMKEIDNRKFSMLSKHLVKTGKMLGGWINDLNKKKRF